MLCVVAPLLQRFPVVELDVKVVEPPEHKEVIPEIVGVDGSIQLPEIRDILFLDMPL